MEAGLVCFESSCIRWVWCMASLATFCLVLNISEIDSVEVLGISSVCIDVYLVAQN